METRETLAELYKDYKGDQMLAATMKEPQAKKTDKLNMVRRRVGLAPYSPTSPVILFHWGWSHLHRVIIAESIGSFS